MKKYFYFASLFLFAAMSVFVSCDDDDDDAVVKKPKTEVRNDAEDDKKEGEGPNPNDSTETLSVVVDNVAFAATNTLAVRSNAEATFTFAGQTQTGTEATFETTAKTGNLKVTATGMRPVEMKVSFAKTDYLEFEVALVSMGNAVPAAVAEATTGAADVTNGADNAADNDGVEVCFNVAGNANDGTTGDYSVTVFTPEYVETNTDVISTNTEANEPVLALDCQPDGAKFRTPITMTVNIPGSEGFNVACVNAENKSDVAIAVANGNQHQFTLDHFSIWDIVLNATGSMTKSTQTITAEGDAGTGSLRYEFDYGFETQTTSTLVSKYLKKVFGITKKKSSKSIRFDAVQGGTAKLTATQEVKTYTFKSNNQTFTATVYGKVTVNNLSITAPAPVAPTIKTHSGGASDL